MNVEDARKILEEEYQYAHEANRLMRGLLILLSLEPNKDLCIGSGHDILWAGFKPFEEIVELMTEEQVREMCRLGWFDYEDYWGHHT